MTIAPITRTHAVPEPQRFLFYPSVERFRYKLRKHFLNPAEPWARVLTREFLMDTGRRLKANDPAAVADAYARIADEIDGGIRFAVARPVYLRADHPKHGADTHYFVAEAGYKIVAYHGTVRTAYFTSDHPHVSAHTLFHNAWRSIRVRALRPLLRSVGGKLAVVRPRDVTDVADPGPRSATEFRVRMYSRENWNICPNPHPVPLPTRSIPQPVADWLDRSALARKDA